MRKKREDKKSNFSSYMVMVNSLDFPELTVKFSNGTSFPLKGKKGEILALEACEPEDVRKSLLAGSLKNCLMSGIIQEIKEDNKDISNISDNISIEKKDGDNEDNEDNEVIKEHISDKVFCQSEKDVLNSESSITSFGYKEISAEGKSRTEHVLLNIEMVKSYDDFKLLPLNLKLEYIHKANRKHLLILNKIISESHSKQLVSNAKLVIALLNEESLKESQ